MNEERRSDGTDDRDLAALLAAAGARLKPAPRAAAEVRAAVEAEWRSTVAARRTRRRFTTWAAAAGVAVAAVAVWIASPWVGPAPVSVASVARVVGDVQRNEGDGRWTPLAISDAIRAGTRVRSGSDGRAAITVASGVELRLDTLTTIAFTDPAHATLDEGAVYVDSGVDRGARSPDFMLETPSGSIRHLGTQYAARIADGALRVGIREGRVEIDRRADRILGEAGEVLVLADDRVTRSPLPPSAAEWDWVATVTPPFLLEGRSVEAFLAWAARETGRTVVYASPEVATRAREIVLRGTVEGLTPDEALAAVLATTSLQSSVENERIRVDVVP